MGKINNKTIILTGGLGLLGRSITEHLSKNNNLVLLDIKKKEKLKKIKNFSKLKNNIFYIKCDVANKNDIKKALRIILKKYKFIDVLINNAAFNDPFIKKINLKKTFFENYSFKDWSKSISINLNSLFLCSQIFGKEMTKNKKGSIINIASIYGMVSPDQNIYQSRNSKNTFIKNPAYPTAKGGMLSFTRYLASYWGRKGIRVNSISPGGIEDKQHKEFIKKYSEKTALGRMAKTKDIVGVIEFLCRDDSSYITGSNIVVDGGWTAV